MKNRNLNSVEINLGWQMLKYECRNTLLIVLIFISFSNSFSVSHRLKIELKTDNDSCYVFFHTEKMDKIDSVLLIGGNGYYKHNYHSSLLYISTGCLNKGEVLYNKGNRSIWLDSSDAFLEGSLSELKETKISNSLSNDVDEQYTSLIQDYNYKKRRGVLTEKDSLIFIEKLNNLVIQYPRSPVSLNNIKMCALFRSIESVDLVALFNLLENDLKKSKNGKNTISYILNQYKQKPSIGDAYINLELLDTNLLSTSLHNHIKKLTYINFWSSGCIPCLKKFPTLKALYSKYKSENFEIIGISSDVNRDKWAKVIKDFSLEWINLSDLNGFTSIPFIVYGIKSNPSSILIDENGQIIAQNISIEELNEFLEDL